MQFMLMIYQATPTLPGSDRWKALSESEQKAIYADYTDLNKAEGVTPGLPLGLPDAARTVQVHDGKVHVKNGPYLAECVGGTTYSRPRAWRLQSTWLQECQRPAWVAQLRYDRPRSTGDQLSLVICRQSMRLSPALRAGDIPAALSREDGAPQNACEMRG